MNFPYSKSQVSRAGKRVISSIKEEAAEAFTIVDAWRAAHGEPLEEMLGVTKEIAKNYPGAFVAGRLKRVDTIVGKLKRPNFSYDLKTLDDIAGCRLVLPEFSDIESAVNALEGHSGFWKKKDYISEPKDDGYRSVHTFHRCDAKQSGLTCLRVEVQIRSGLQHAWSTAVESYDLRPGSKMKFGGGMIGERCFFRLVSEQFAQIEKNGLENSLNQIEFQEKNTKLVEMEQALHIFSWLKGFSQSVSLIQSEEVLADARAFLITFNYENQFISIRPYGLEEIAQAPLEYSKAEKNAKDDEVILLVQANSLEEIQATYPNYFSDISLFLDSVQALFDGSSC